MSKASLKAIPRYFPAFKENHLRGLRPWAGLRPCPPDGLPYIGPHPGLKNTFIATGHAMMGLSLAPATARLLADHLENPAQKPRPLLDPAPLRLKKPKRIFTPFAPFFAAENILTKK